MMDPIIKAGKQKVLIATPIVSDLYLNYLYLLLPISPNKYVGETSVVHTFACYLPLCIFISNVATPYQ